MSLRRGQLAAATAAVCTIGELSGLLPDDLCAGWRLGYEFKLEPSRMGYAVIARPETFNRTGRRSFYSDETQMIHQFWGKGPATIDSPVLALSRN